jgi:photosynthetic reaction center cytochrome c subunit
MLMSYFRYVLFILLLGARVSSAPPPQKQSAIATKTAAQAYKNIQVLKTVPADEVISTMQFIALSLGVECDFCHVEREWDKDDKKPKRIAREMMRMMLAINSNNFSGERKVTCNTCHRGTIHPQPIPAITARVEQGDESSKVRNAETEDLDPATLASGTPILAKFIEALGGESDLDKISDRVEKGTVSTGNGRQFPVEIFARSPDQRVSITHLPSADSVTAYNGKTGWLILPGRPAHEMSALDQIAAKLEAVVFFPVHLGEIFEQIKAQPQTEAVGGSVTNVMLGLSKGQPTAKFYFDQPSGLLIRMLHYTDTALGLIPTQIDFSDYRSVNGVKTPFRWTLSRPGSAFTVQIDQVQNNVPIVSTIFVQPAQEPSTASPPPTQ